jgi:cell division protein FtsW
MAIRPLNVAPAGPMALPATGLGRGWEPGILMGVTLLLFSFGLVTLSSATTFLAHRAGAGAPHYVLQQAIGGALGLAVLVVCSRMPYQWWKHLAWPILGVTWVLLIIVILPWTEAIAPEVNGARRWLLLPGGRVQPSDLAKLAIVIWTATLAVKKQPHFKSLRRGMLPFLLIWLVVLLPIAKEDFSTACMVGIMGATVLFAAGGRIAHFILLGCLAAPLVLAKLGSGFRGNRIEAFLNPGSDPSGADFQVHQSLLAIGSGGFMGVGFGEGRQKYGFLPEPHNDFIFAMVGEEWGLLGIVFLVSLYLTLILVGFRVARRAQDLFGELLAIGLTSLIALHAVLHMGVGLRLVPATGLALPFISYGRSNLVVTMAAVGILIAIARQQPGLGRERG